MRRRDPKGAAMAAGTAASAAPRREICRQACVVLSSRVRLARNLRGARFPDWATQEQREELLERIAPAVMKAVDDPEAALLEMSGLDERQREILVERWVVSRDLVQRGSGAAVVLAHDSTVAVMINEEDHIRIQAINPGLSLAQCLEMAEAIDTRLEELLPYAFSRRLGYLTACPSNIGTGMRASVMAHLPGLRLMGEIDAVVRSLERLHLNVRGIGGEGSVAAGQRFQISNQGTLGFDEASVVRALEKTAQELARLESAARLRVLRDEPLACEDCLSRALALLKEARLMPAEEALDYLSAVRLGMEMGILRGITPLRLAQLERMVLPGHMQNFYGVELDAETRDQYRATLMNRNIAGCRIDMPHMGGKSKKRVSARKK